MSEMVGSAYVRIHMDTRGARREINRAMREAGSDGGEDYGQAFEEAVERRFRDNRRQLIDALGEGDMDRYRRRWGSVAETIERATDELKAMRAEGRLTHNDFQKITAELRHWERIAGPADEMERAHGPALELRNRINAMARDQEQHHAARMRERRQQMDAALRAISAEQAAWRNMDQERLNREMGQAQDEARRINARLEAMSTAAEREHAERMRLRRQQLNAALQAISQEESAERDAAQRRARFEMARIQEIANAENKLFDARRRAEVELQARRLRFDDDGSLARFAGRLDAVAHRGGTAMNLLLAIPRAVVGFTRVVQFAFRPLADFGKRLDDIGKATGGFAGALARVGGAFLRFGPTLIAAVGGAVVFGKAIGVMAAAISLAGGIITAWYGALQTAVVGTILPALPLVGALGGAFLMFGGAVRAAGPDLKKFIDSLDNLNAAHENAARTIAREMVGSLGQMRDVLDGPVASALSAFGQGVAKIPQHFADAINSPAVSGFLDMFERTMPATVDNLGAGFAKLLEGALAFFTPILPFAQRLSEKFLELMERFSTWASSTEGQNEIANFMHRAWTAADSLWTALGNLWTAIQNVLNLGSGTSQSFLDSLVANTQKFREWTQDPANADKIREWFTKAKEFADLLWDGLERIGGWFDDLDTEDSREDLDSLGDSLSTLADNVERVADTVGGAIEAYDKFSGAIEAFEQFVSGGGGNPLETIGASFDAFGDKVREVMDTFGDTVRGAFISLGEWLDGIGDSIRDFIVAPFQAAYDLIVGNSIVPDLIDEVIAFLTDLPGKAAEALANLAGDIGEKFTDAADDALETVEDLISDVVDELDDLPGKAASALSTLAGRISQRFTETRNRAIAVVITFLAEAVQRISELPGRAASALSGLAGRIGGMISSAKTTALGIWNRFPSEAREALSRVAGAVTGALSGVAGAVGRVLSGVFSTASRWWERISGVFSSVRTAVRNFRLPDLPFFAEGTIATSPTMGVFGEAGAEAVVPLDRPLHLVDPSVRQLSAIAQGKVPVQQGTGGPQRVVNVEPGAIQVITPSTNPYQVASSVLDRIAVAAR